MTVGTCYDPIFLEHTLPDHPENANRLRAVMTLLNEKHALASVQSLTFSPATFEELTVVHTPAYVSRVYQMCESGRSALNPDTYLNQASFAAASMAAGASLAAADAVMKGEVARSFVLARPPGHHAFADHGEGFCLFNTIAFAVKRVLGDFEAADNGWSPAATRAQRNARPERAMIVDFDVHHGNGTQSLFYDDPRVLYVSTHEYGWPMYPGTGGANEQGAGAGKGSTINVPLPAGTGDMGYSSAFDQIIVPAARRFQPDMLFVSAGFDAHWRDPLARMLVSLTGFARMMAVLCELSDELCEGKLVTVLEGGYDYDALAYGVLNTLRIMQSDISAAEDPLGLNRSRETPVGDVIRNLSDLYGLTTA